MVSGLKHRHEAGRAQKDRDIYIMAPFLGTIICILRARLMSITVLINFMQSHYVHDRKNIADHLMNLHCFCDRFLSFGQFIFGMLYLVLCNFYKFD